MEVVMLISFTGIDGCGKGTQIEYLAQYLESKGHEVSISKAYGSREKELFSIYIEHCSQEAILFLFQAFHVEQRLRAEKALALKKIVLADRWDESYEAYHSEYGILSEDKDLRCRINEIAFGNVKPDLVFFLKTPVDVAMERCAVRGADFFDRKSREHHEKTESKLTTMSEELGWVILDGSLPPLEIHKIIVSNVEEIL